MKIKFFTLFLLFLIVIACGTKVSKSTDAMQKEVYVLVEKTNTNSSLEQSVVEGALTNASGTADIGSFKIQYFFDAETKTLLRIKNIETTNKILTENFYFNNNELIFIDFEKSGETKKQLFIDKGRIVNSASSESEYTKILLNKAKMFQKEFKNAQ